MFFPDCSGSNTPNCFGARRITHNSIFADFTHSEFCLFSDSPMTAASRADKTGTKLSKINRSRAGTKQRPILVMTDTDRLAHEPVKNNPAIAGTRLAGLAR